MAVSLTCSLVVLATLAGCGSGEKGADGPISATDSSASSSESSGSAADSPDAAASPRGSSEGAGASLPVGDSLEPGQALIVSASNTDGPTSQLASALVDDQAVETFVAGIDAQLAGDVRAAVKLAQVPAGSMLFAAVVTVGCDTPTQVSWERTSDRVRTSATLPKSKVQCLVPVTSVALFLVEDAV